MASVKPAVPPRPGGPSKAAPPTLGGPAYLRLIGLGAAVGIPAALVAAGFLALVHDGEHWLWTDLPHRLGESSPPFYLVLGLPVIGAIVVIAARRWLPGDGGHDPLRGGLGLKPTPWTYAPGVALAALGTLMFGAVLGPEGPLIALGAIVGNALSTSVKLDSRGTAVLGTAGSFSAVSALFGGPLVAGMLIVESGIGLGAELIPLAIPGLVAAACGYVLFVGLGSWGGLNSTALTFPGLPVYHGTHLLDLILAIGVGVTASVAMTGIRRLGTTVSGLTPRLRMPWLLIAGGLAVGAIALLADGLGADSQDVLFSGQSSIPMLVEHQPVKIVLILLVAKGIAYAISLGSGFRGGPIFPAIFTGVALAAITEHAFNRSPTFAVAVGAAAGMTAMTRLVFASLLFSALLVGEAGADTIPAAVLATTAAWVTLKVIDRDAAHPHEAAAAPT